MGQVGGRGDSIVSAPRPPDWRPAIATGPVTTLLPSLRTDQNLPGSVTVPAESALGPYLRAIRAHRLLVVLVVAASLAGSLAWLALRTPDYTGTAQLLVTPLPQDDDTFLGVNLIRDSGDPTRTVQTAASQILTPEAAGDAASRMGGGYTADAVLDAVAVEPVGETNILAVTATAEGAERAARLANEFASAALAVRRDDLRRQIDVRIGQLRVRQGELQGNTGETAAALTERLNQLESVRNGADPTLQLSQRATVPGSSDGPPSSVIVVLALIAGLALGGGAAVLSELLNRRIRDEEEATALFPLPVLARVPVLPRRLRRSSRTPWHLPPQVREAFRTLILQLTQDHPRRVIMITSASTGDGKTNSAINLAVSLAAAGHSTILMDFDIRKPDVARSIGIDEFTPLSDLLAFGKNRSSSLDEFLITAPLVPSLRVLATGAGPSGDAALVEALNSRLPELIAAGRELAEFVVLDTAPLGEVSDALRVADEVDSIVIVSRPGNTNRVNFDVMRDLLERTDHEPDGMLVIGEAPGMSRDPYGYGIAAREQRKRDSRLGRLVRR